MRFWILHAGCCVFSVEMMPWVHLRSVFPISRTRVRAILLEVLMIALCAMLCGAEGCIDMEAFGKATERFLKRFLTLPHGIPSHDRCAPAIRC